MRIVGEPACTCRTILYCTMTYLDKPVHNPIQYLKYIETKIEIDGSGPFRTQPMGKPTANGERFSSVEKYSNERFAW